MPEIAPDITAEELDKEVREELRSLPSDLAELIGRHLVAAERALQEDDTDKAHEHTKVARRFAARIGVVREAAGIVAYRAGHFSEALSDLRAARRMTGSEAYLPVMADCERGLGRPERALDLVRSPESERLDKAGRIELAIVESGARRDLGQHDAAVITLQRVAELRDPQPKPWSARLAFAYADALADAGHQDAATDWFAKAMAFDEDGETDAAERYAELTGAHIEDIEEDDDYEDDSDDSDDSEVDEEADDAAAFAEAGDLLDGPSEAADVSTEAGDASDVDDVSDEPGDASDEDDEPSDTEGARAAVSNEDDELDEMPDDSDDDDSDDDSRYVTGEEDEPEDALTEADDQLADAERSEVLAEPAQGPDADVSAQGDAGSVAESHGSSTAGITPAFIEPDFGDILDQPDEPGKGDTKRTD